VKDEDKDNRVYLRHILEAIGRIESFTKAGRDQFYESELQQNAVIWNIGVIGEATRQISNWLRDAHPGIPWQEIVAMRNRLVHEYFNVDLALVWDWWNWKALTSPSEVALRGEALYPRS